MPALLVFPPRADTPHLFSGNRPEFMGVYVVGHKKLARKQKQEWIKPRQRTTARNALILILAAAECFHNPTPLQRAAT
jgi:hypothetical protein